MICNPEGNGSTGKEGTEAVATYFLSKSSSLGAVTGNIPVCEGCAETVSPFFDIVYFDGRVSKLPPNALSNPDPKINSGIYSHDWEKLSLMGIEVEGKVVDQYKCKKCGAEGYWTLADFLPESGCSSPSEQEEEEGNNSRRTVRE